MFALSVNYSLWLPELADLAHTVNGSAHECRDSLFPYNLEVPLFDPLCQRLAQLQQ